MTPRIITRKEYDACVSGQKKFYDDLIEKGLLAIEGAKEQPAADAPEIKKSDDRPLGPLHRLKNKRVIVSLLTQDRIQGILSEVWQYELIIITPDGPLAVLKHAVVSVREVGI